MKICVLIPHESSRSHAGVRIRYLRIEKTLRQQGHSVAIRTISELGKGALDEADVYLISKCYDARSLILSAHLSRQGKLVGVDLFDDYFSQIADSHFMRLRQWLQELLEFSDFVVCSTPRLRDVVGGYTVLPTHVMNDPAPETDIAVLAESLRRKAKAARESHRLDVAWFGIGDHPDFAVGLRDLVAFSDDLARLRRSGYNVILRILTNEKAVRGDVLAALRRIPVPFQIDDWSLEREQSLLTKSLLCFLPVNAQAFSIAKSLNRAISALAAGSQVLSTGYPLYERLDPLIYSRVQDFAPDLEAGTLRLRGETIPILETALDRWASPLREAENLVRFLSQLKTGRSAIFSRSGIAVVHGRHTSRDVHNLAASTNVLSIASPYCAAEWDFDLIFRFAPGAGIEAFIARSQAAAIEARLRLPSPLSDKVTIGGREMLKLSTTILPATARRRLGVLANADAIPSFVAGYPIVMGVVRDALRLLYPGTICLHSEQGNGPWWVPNGGPGAERDRPDSAGA